MPRRYISLTALFLLASSSAVAADARKEHSQGGQVCKRLNARLMTVAVTDGCLSPVNFCAEGLITGDGLIQGRTFATVLGLIESVGFPGIEPATTMGYVGDRLIETRNGNLNLRFTGVFDTARGEFSELERVLVAGGTGEFEGATGTVYLTGRSNAEGNAFVGRITGKICSAPGNGN